MHEDNKAMDRDENTEEVGHVVDDEVLDELSGGAAPENETPEQRKLRKARAAKADRLGDAWVVNNCLKKRAEHFRRLGVAMEAKPERHT